MNRKIFTLLAVALMLFTTAYYANARRVAGNSVGALVKTLPDGKSKGMYHIQVDSICLRVGTAGSLKWVPVTYENLGTDASLRFIPNSTPSFGTTTSATQRDTIILATTETGRVVMISARHLRESIFTDDAYFNDLQAAMWCIDVEQPETWAQLPTFHFTNKIFDLDLDWDQTAQMYVDNSHRGWMYSYSYENEMLNNKRPFYRHNTQNGNYRVVIAQLNAAGTLPTGNIHSTDVTIESFVSDTVPGMLKFSIVKVSPIVLTAEEYNSQLGLTDGDELFKLKFSPEPTQRNYFGYYLKAYNSTAHDDYLNLEIYNDDGTTTGNYIANYNGAKGGDKYNNEFSIEYLNILANSGRASNANYNKDYRLVFFPSDDSLVINAYYVKHDTHNEYNNGAFNDSYNYTSDAPGAAPYYYGLYNDSIHVALIVRYQDLSGIAGPSSLMTIGRHPANTRIYFGDYSCDALITDVWMPAKGVYTIWDKRGRALGIRIYNGTYTPQWLELEDVECPDRIPSYQWVVEPEEDGKSKSRVKITSREFGDNSTGAASILVTMRNVMIKRGYWKIFAGQTHLKYHPLVLAYYEQNTSTGGIFYQPITNGEVKGEYLPVMASASDCGTGGTFDYSGFRPVITQFLYDEHLGYKWFNVFNTDASSPKFGKSEDLGEIKGMDYNAFAFNYLSGLGLDGYITLGERYNEQLLKVERGADKWTGFQFMLGKHLRDHQFQEEIFGYPRTAWSGLPRITDVAPYFNPNYAQTKVPVLKRFYYELKVADYYQYRDGLAEQFVVLKGAKDDGTDIKNAMFYGVDDIWGEKHPFKFANIYLRETYFIPMAKKNDFEERHKYDDTRRIYYALLDRIEVEQIKRVTSFGLQVSDTLYSDDGTHPYNLVGVDVNFSIEGFAQAIGKTGQAINIATFALENVNYPLYRRLRSLRDDNADPDGDGVDQALGAKLGTNLDAPKTIRINTYRNQADYLHEDNMSSTAYGYGINFLGIINSAQYKEGEYAADGTVKYNYHLFADTAFINRGTGPIKPQYLFAVGQKVVTGGQMAVYDYCENRIIVDLQPYVIGRYLVNATDSARKIGSDGDAYAEVRDKRFIFDTNWDRLVFVDAIHVHDRLYILSELYKAGVTDDDIFVTGLDGEKYIHGAWLYELTKNKVDSGNVERIGKPGPLYNKARRYTDMTMYGAYYDFGHWDNFHNDVCFSLRFTQPFVQNPNAQGLDTYENIDKRFRIESETTNRTPYGNRKIAPVQGGWIMIQNRVPVLSRTSYEDPIQQSEIFNIADPVVTSWQDGVATGNDAVNAKVEVIAGVGLVTISNAAGKQVTITNLLGQTVANKVLAGDNENVNVAQGLFVVNVEGEKTVKVVIK